MDGKQSVLLEKEGILVTYILSFKTNSRCGYMLLLMDE